MLSYLGEFERAPEILEMGERDEQLLRGLINCRRGMLQFQSLQIINTILGAGRSKNSTPVQSEQ